MRAAPHVTLERLGEAHLADMEALTSDAEVLRYTRIPEPVPDGFAREWLDRYVAGQEHGTCAGFAALDEDGRFLGLGLAVAILAFVIARRLMKRPSAEAEIEVLEG